MTSNKKVLFQEVVLIIIIISLFLKQFIATNKWAKIFLVVIVLEVSGYYFGSNNDLHE